MRKTVEIVTCDVCKDEVECWPVYIPTGERQSEPVTGRTEHGHIRVDLCGKHAAVVLENVLEQETVDRSDILDAFKHIKERVWL